MNISEIILLKEETKIPVIEGILTKICEPSMQGTEFPTLVQNIYLTEPVQKVGKTIKVKLRSEKHHLTEEVVGSLITFAAGKVKEGKLKGKVSGITVKQYKNASYVVVTQSADMVIEEQVESVKPAEEKVEEEVQEDIAEGPSDDLIQQILDERLYIAKKVLIWMNGLDDDKWIGIFLPRLNELVTSILIPCERAGRGILPKKKHVERVKKLNESKGNHLNKKDGWRNFFHEKADKKLGQYSKEELIEKFGPWYHKTDKDRLTKDSFQAKCHDALGEAFKEFDYGVMACYLDCAEREAKADEEVALGYLMKRFKLKNAKDIKETHAKQALASSKDTFEEIRNQAQESE